MNMPSNISGSKSRQRSFFFLTALFIQAAEVVNNFNVEPEKMASEFRNYLQEGMSYDSHGPNRISFYENVKTRATEVR